VVEIYRESFPDSQRVADEMLLRFVPQPQEEPGGWVFHVAEARQGVAGFAVALHVSSMSLAYLAYLAVGSEWRGRGIGSALFRSVVAHWSRLRPKPPHWLFLEVERPELAADDDERIRRERRIRFYERLGCQRLDADFQAPPLGPSLPVVPYWILMLPIRDPDLRPAAVRAALADIYREVYGLEEDHPLVENCLASAQ
jgi:GNAT superfamily N-acetyltransferase